MLHRQAVFIMKTVVPKKSWFNNLLSKSDTGRLQSQRFSAKLPGFLVLKQTFTGILPLLKGIYDILCHPFFYGHYFLLLHYRYNPFLWAADPNFSEILSMRAP